MKLFVLIMAQYDEDPAEWIYSKSASTKDALEDVDCYPDPPNSLPRSDYNAIDSWKLTKPLRPCDRPNDPPVDGTIYLLQANA